MAPRPDPDALAALEEQRDFLLASLRDLEVEHDAGDLDDGDLEGLRDDYTARAAAVIRAIDDHEALVVASRPPRAPLRTLGWVVGVLVFAVLAGVLMAQASGRRNSDDSITGDIPLTNRQRLADCQQALGAMELDEAIDCYDDAIAADPSSAEAFAYRGWAVALRSFGGGDPDVTELEEALEWLGRSLDAEATYPDALAFRIVVLARMGSEDELDAAFAAFDAVDAPQQMKELVDTLRGGGLVATPALACRNLIDVPDLVGALRCFDDVLEGDADDAEALSWKGWTLALTGFSADLQDQRSLAEELWASALELETQAVAVVERSDSPTSERASEAYAFQAIVLDALGRAEEADAALVVLFSLDPDPALLAGVVGYIPDAADRASP